MDGHLKYLKMQVHAKDAFNQGDSYDYDAKSNPRKGVRTFTDFIRSEFDTLRSDSRDSYEGQTGCRLDEKLPVEIHWSPEMGRYLVASKDIAAGEAIVLESPLLLAPKPGSDAACLACLNTWQIGGAICEKCGGPLCSMNCIGKGHTIAECNLIKSLCFKATDDIRNNFKELSVVLAPLRMYLQMQESQFSRDVINALQSHLKNRRALPIGRIVEEKIVTVFQTGMGLDVESSMIHHLCGVLDTNSFEVSIDNTNRVRALFTISSMMNHSCLPNTQRWFANGKMIVRAASDILKGTPVTTNYTQTLWGTRARSTHLSTCKMFRCVCERCIDPTELDSHLSSLLCKNCKVPEGLLIPPGNFKESWKCRNCGVEISADGIQAMVCAASIVFSRVNIADPQEILAAFKHLCKLLGAQHYIPTELKYAFVEAIMKHPMKDVTTENLISIMNMTEDLLILAEKIEPALSRFRGLLLLNRGQAYVELLKRHTSSFDCTTSTEQTNEVHRDLFSEDFLTDILRDLTECEFILTYDTRCKEVSDVLNEIRSLYLKE